MDPTSYLDRIKALNIEKYAQLYVSNVAEAKQILVEVRGSQNWLRQIKREINLEVKSIRNDYREKALSAGAGGATVFTLLGKPGFGRSYKASAKRQLAAERDRLLDPYEQLRLVADRGLEVLGSIKLQLTNYIEQVETQERAAKTVEFTASQPVALNEKKSRCSQCGNQVEIDDKFCRNCGRKLGLDEDEEVPPPPIVYPPGLLGGNG